MTVRGRPPDGNPDGPSGPSGHGPLLSQRAAPIICTALVIGTAAGVLTYLAARRAPDAVLAGGAAFAAAISALNTLIA